MEDLFKIGEIDGKGLGWIALQDIKAGTLIYKEKLQFVPKKNPENDEVYLLDLMNSFYAMSENDQKEFLERDNPYLDLNSLPDEKKKCYFFGKMLLKVLSEQDKPKKRYPSTATWY